MVDFSLFCRCDPEKPIKNRYNLLALEQFSQSKQRFFYSISILRHDFCTASDQKCSQIAVIDTVALLSINGISENSLISAVIDTVCFVFFSLAIQDSKGLLKESQWKFTLHHARRYVSLEMPYFHITFLSPRELLFSLYSLIKFVPGYTSHLLQNE